MSKCPPGCVCGRHKPSLKRGIPLTSECRAKLSRVRKGRTPWNKGLPGTNLGKKFSAETRKRMSESMTGLTRADTSKIQEVAQSIATTAPHRFSGGKIADEFARVLLPAGFVREYHIKTNGEHERYLHYRIDFAYPSCKIGIELDGPSHNRTVEMDRIREQTLNLMGWTLIHIKHDGKETINGVASK